MILLTLHKIPETVNQIHFLSEEFMQACKLAEEWREKDYVNNTFNISLVHLNTECEEHGGTQVC